MIVEDLLLHQFKEKQIFDAAGQPFAPVNIINAIYDNTGHFNNKGASSEVTTIISLDKSEGDAASSLMFKLDEINLEKHIDSLAD